MKIVFCGGKNIGYNCLKHLIQHSEIEVALIIPNLDSDISPDRWYLSVTEVALTHNIPLLGTNNINENFEEIKQVNPDCIFSVYFDQIFKKTIIDLPVKGIINLHFGLPEYYRGCYPTTWAIINGEKLTGVTLHYVDEGIDTGDIIAERLIEIKKGYTGKDLYNLCTEIGFELFKDMLPLIINDKCETRKQNNGKAYHHDREFPSHEVKLPKDVYNYIRALIFAPFPSPFFNIGNKKITIMEEL